MANINVADLLADPDFVDPVKLISRTPIVNSRGENTITESAVDTVGSIQPSSGKDLARLPEGLRVANMSTFWVRGTITVSGPGKYPMLIEFRGQRYQIAHVFDWTNWGDGWCEGMAVAEVPS